jgi:hypothetical protein
MRDEAGALVFRTFDNNLPAYAHTLPHVGIKITTRKSASATCKILVRVSLCSPLHVSCIQFIADHELSALRHMRDQSLLQKPPSARLWTPIGRCRAEVICTTSRTTQLVFDQNRIFANLSGRHCLQAMLSTPQLATKAIEYMGQTQILGQVGIRNTQTTPSAGRNL